MTLGHNGYLAVVPGTSYAASSIHASWAGFRGLPPGTWVETTIAHIGDDPLWIFLSEDGEDGADNRKINALHRAPFRATSALTREAGTHVLGLIDEAFRAEGRKRLRAAMRDIRDWRSITLARFEMGAVRESGRWDCQVMEAGHE